jgi:hypothetical protein
MWVEVKTASNLIIAEMWKEYFEGEGIPAKLVREPGDYNSRILSSYRIMVTQEKVHVVEEVLRKL